MSALAVKREPIWTPAFMLLCAAAFFANGHQSLLQPTLPLYLTSLGASPFLFGLLQWAFSGTSILVRPFIGYWADRWSIPGVLMVGCVLLGLSGLFFLIPIVPLIFAINSLRGVGWAGYNTGNFTMLAQAAPPSRRGEASGYFSSVQGTVTILFPALALWIIPAPFGGFGAVLALSGVFGLIGAAIGAVSYAAQRRAEQKTASRRTATGLTLIDPSVLIPMLLLLGVILPQPAVTSFIVLYARDIGISGIAWYFVASGITSVVARPLVGRLSDRFGRRPALAFGFICCLAGLALLAAVPRLAGFIMGGIFFSLGSATVSSTTTALAMERADMRWPARAMATFSQAYQIGVGTGAFISGSIVSLAGYTGMYLAMLLIVASALALTIRTWRSLAPVPRLPDLATGPA